MREGMIETLLEAVIAAEIDEDNLKPITKLPLEYQVR